MIIAEWIVWGIACIVLLTFIGAALTTRDSGLRRHHTQHCFLLTIGLVVTIITPMSKLHLLWWVPITFVINMLLSNLFTVGRFNKGLREFEQQRLRSISHPGEIKESGTYDNVVADKETGLYHYRECEYARIIEITKGIWFGSESDAQEHGFKPCELCSRIVNDGEPKGNHS
jgi:hypothetical protein